MNIKDLTEAELMILERLIDATERGLPVGFDFIAQTDKLDPEEVSQGLQNLIRAGYAECITGPSIHDASYRATTKGFKTYDEAE